MRSTLLAAVCCFAILAAAASQDDPNLPPTETQQAAEVDYAEPSICNVDCLCEQCDCDPCECQGAKADASDERPIIYFFTADWCAPCREMKPLSGRLHDEGHRIYSVDFDTRQDLVGKYGVTSVPQFVVVDGDGKVVRRVIGTTTKERVLGLDPARVTGTRQSVINEPTFHVQPPQQTGRLFFRRGMSRSVCGPGGCR